MPRPAPPPVAPIAASAPQLPPPALLAADWRDRPFTAGIWSLGGDDRASVAQFGLPGASPDFLIRCVTASKSIYLSRAGTLHEGGVPAITLASTETAKTYHAANSRGAPTYIWSETPANDPQLDLLAFSRGRILVSIAGMDDLVLPSWPEFARIVEDCRGEEKSALPARPQPSQSDAKIF